LRSSVLVLFAFTGLLQITYFKITGFGYWFL